MPAGFMMMDPRAILKIEADQNGQPRQKLLLLHDDFPHGAHDARHFAKRAALLEAQNHRCAYCGVHFNDPAHDRSFDTIDHVVPRVAGGVAIWSNEIMACDMCNRGRGAMFAGNYFRAVKEMGRLGAYYWGRRKAMKAAQAKSRQRNDALAAALKAVT